MLANRRRARLRCRIIKLVYESEEWRERLGRVVVVIPALEPGGELVGLVAELVGLGLGKVLVVDDGSSVWPEVVGAEVVRMARQRGKGAALKAGFAWLLESGEVWEAVVTADSDGQHRAVDVARVAAAGGDVVLGVRGMKSGVPWRSWVGNGLTQRLFGLAAGRRLRDTQTGLRRFAWGLLPELVGIAGERYEYELAVLLWCCERGLEIGEIEIATVYEAGNAGSHFRVVGDSVRVWGVLWRWWRR
jgi:glycosyltransferase involved in cell wall biosynthesis